MMGVTAWGMRWAMVCMVTPPFFFSALSRVSAAVTFFRSTSRRLYGQAGASDGGGHVG